MSLSPRLLTVILNYRTAEMTLRATEAALREMDGIAGEIVVVDNDSGDGSFDKMRSHAEQAGWTKGGRVRVLQSGHNGGYGAGNNVGIRAGLSSGEEPDYVYLLNSDAFPQEGAIRALLETLQSSPSYGLAGSYIHGEHGDAHVTSFRFPSIAGEFEGALRLGIVSRLLANKRVPMEVPSQSQRVDWLAGASVMIRQSVLERIGLFDETFFLYFEETDLCLRAHRAGIETIYVRESEVMHIGSVSTGMKNWQRVPDYWFASRRHYYEKNHGHLYAAFATGAHIIGGGLHRLRCVLQRRQHDMPPHFLRSLLAHEIGRGLVDTQARPRIDTKTRQEAGK